MLKRENDRLTQELTVQAERHKLELQTKREQEIKQSQQLEIYQLKI